MKTYIVDKDKSKITWKGSNQSMSNHGQVKFKSGKFFTELGDIVEGFVGIDFTTLKVSEDNQLDKENEKKLAEHLKSKEFLNIEKYPTAEYKIKELKKKNGEATIKGILTLKEEAYGLNFPANISINEKHVEARGNFKLQNINPLVKERISAEYEGEPIETIELEFKIVADAESL